MCKYTQFGCNNGGVVMVHVSFTALDATAVCRN